MANAQLDELLDTADALQRDSVSWLLDASTLSEAITDSILSHPEQLAAVKRVVRDAAQVAGCDWIVGASSEADRMVRDLNSDEVEASRVLLFELVRVTGSTIHQSTDDLRHVDVVPAVLVDLRGESASEGVIALTSSLKETLSR